MLKLTFRMLALGPLLWCRSDVRNICFKTLYGDQFRLSTLLIILNYPVILSHWCSTINSFFSNLPPLFKCNSTIVFFFFFFLRGSGNCNFLHSIKFECYTFAFNEQIAGEAIMNSINQFFVLPFDHVWVMFVGNVRSLYHI